MNLTWGNLDCNTEYPYIDFCFTWNKNNYMETGKMTYAFEKLCQKIITPKQPLTVIVGSVVIMDRCRKDYNVFDFVLPGV